MLRRRVQDLVGLFLIALLSSLSSAWAAGAADR